jgi:hypothetical protein
MTKLRPPPCATIPAQSQAPSLGTGSPTVASLGVRVRIVPVDVNFDSELAGRIASCERLQAEVEDLLTRLRRLREAGFATRDHDCSPPRSGV